MLKLKFKKIVASVLSLALSAGLCTGLMSGNVSAGVYYQLPSDYSGLGYFLNYHNEKPEVVGYHDTFALSNIQGRIIKKNGKQYLHFSTDWEISMDPNKVWGITNGYNSSFSGGVTQGTFDGDSYSGNTYSGTWYVGTTTFGYIGPDGKISITYTVGGRTYTSDALQVYVPSNASEGCESYYGWEKEYDYELPSNIGNITELSITNIIGQNVQMKVYADASYLDCVKDVAIVNHSSNGTYTLQVDASVANGGWYDVKCVCESGTYTEQVSMSRGDNSVTVDFPSKPSYVSLIKSSYGTVCNYHDIEDWSYTFSYRTYTTSNANGVMTLNSTFNYTVNTLGNYILYYQYTDTNGTNKIGTALAYIDAKSGSVTVPIAFIADSVYKVRFTSMVSPDGLVNHINKTVYEDVTKLPTTLQATVNAEVSNSTTYTIVNIDVDYFAPASGTYYMVYSVNGDTKSTAFNVSQGAGSVHVGSRPTVMMNKSADDNVTLISIEDSDGNVVWTPSENGGQVYPTVPEEPENPYTPTSPETGSYAAYVESNGTIDIANPVSYRASNSTNYTDGVYVGLDFIYNNLPSLGRFTLIFDYEDDNGQAYKEVPIDIATKSSGTYSIAQTNGSQSLIQFPSTTTSVSIIGVKCPDGSIVYYDESVYEEEIVILTEEQAEHLPLLKAPGPRIATTTADTSNSDTTSQDSSSQQNTTPASSAMVSFAERMYTSALSRACDTAGRDYWVSQLQAGMSGADVARNFFFSEELTNANISNEEFVTRLYRTFMDREPDQAGLSYWLDALNNGSLDRNGVFDGFINSQEWANICLRAGIVSGGSTAPSITVEPSEAVIAFATRLYTTCLNRDGEADGVNYWSTELANGRLTGTQAAQNFFFSDEFTNANLSNEEFVTRLYRTFMGREPDTDGFNYWVGQMASGTSRMDVFTGFSASDEFAAVCSDAGIIR